ncbi:MAG: hypothetical protein KGZ68_11000 [Dechloromonas sp.]|nr:hypothetical protein [Dechloromonas sp.]
MSKIFTKEVDLCAAFLAEVERQSSKRHAAQDRWTAYAETAGFDIVLVRKADGVQIGIEAKLTLNTAVVSQALQGSDSWRKGVDGPDYRAVLVPEDATKGLAVFCRPIGLTVLTCGVPRKHVESRLFDPPLPRVDDPYDYFSDEYWHQWCPVHRLPLPEYVPDVAAGASGPIALTTWKIKAIKIAILLEERPVTRADFKYLDLSPTRWMTPAIAWLVPAPGARGYVAGPYLPDFKAQHPRAYDEILADKEKWEPKALAQSKQEALL